jgi:GAF domain-containing protein
MPRTHRKPDDKAADPLQTIADLRRELARAQAERDEALAQQNATAEVLQVINSSPGDLAPVFDAMLEWATRLCEPAFGFMLTWDGECFHRVAWRGVPSDLARQESLAPQPGAPGDRILRGENIVRITDLAQDEAIRDTANIRRLVSFGGRSYIAVALRKDNKLLGNFAIYRREVRPFSDKEIVLLQSFAAQAVIAMENAQLLGELRQRTRELEESLEYQTATSDVLKVISRSTFDLQPMLDTLVHTAARLCGADFGALSTREAEIYRVRASFALVPEFDQYLRERTFTPGRDSVIGRTALERGVVHIADCASDPEFTVSEAVTIGNLRTMLGVPLLREGEPIGVLVLSRQRIEPFTEQQIELVRTLADQAVIAIENTRLLTETREALDQQTATAEVLQVITSSPGDLAPVFDAMLDRALRLCTAAIGYLMTYDGNRFERVAQRGLPERFIEYLRLMPVQPGPGGGQLRVLRGERFVQFADMKDDEAYRNGANPAHRAMVDLGGARTGLIVPLRKDDALVGTFTIYRQEVRQFSEKEIALLENFAAQAVIAMENARLITETLEALEQQTATAEVLQVINSSPGDLAPVFDAILEKAHSLCGAAFGGLMVRDGLRFHGVALHGVPAPFAEVLRRGFEPGPGSPVWRLMQGESLAQIPDFAEIARQVPDDPVARAAVELGGIRTLLIVPLRKDNTLLGYITAFRQEVRPFSEKQVTLLQNFAAQAVIAMENARLIIETREALDQQTATAEVLQVINSSPGDLAPVFDAMLDKAMRLCEAAFGVLWSYDGEHLRAEAHRGATPAYAEILSQGPHPADASGLTRRFLSGERFHHGDSAAGEGYRSGRNLSRALVDLDGARSHLAVPLRKDDGLLGFIVLYRREVRDFEDKQIALLQNFAAQAVIAMENARLITETRERTRDLQESLEYQTATSDVLRVISQSTFDLQPVLDTVVETAARLCEADKAMIYRLSDGLYRTAASFGFPSEYKTFIERNPITPSRGTLTGRTAIQGTAVHIEDATTDPEYTWGESQQRGNLRSLLGVPLFREGEVVGVITLARSRVEPFTEKQIALVTTFADQAVIAIENARLLGELRARTDEIAGWNRELEARVATQLAEIERAGKLRRFLAPQLADLIVAQGDESILESHRREIVVVFCDLRGFTGFAERTEPEEVMALLRDYHAAMGPIVARFEGTLDHYAGDGIMVFFNDPLPTPDPARRAIDMAVAMRAAAQGLLRSWRRHGHDIGFGVGISQGYATLGQIGFAERMDYTAIGTVTNLAARLCAEAKDGQILVSRRVAIAVEDSAELEEIGDLSLKGLSQAVAVYNVPQ